MTVAQSRAAVVVLESGGCGCADRNLVVLECFSGLQDGRGPQGRACPRKIGPRSRACFPFPSVAAPLTVSLPLSRSPCKTATDWRWRTYMLCKRRGFESRSAGCTAEVELKRRLRFPSVEWQSSASFQVPSRTLPSALEPCETRRFRARSSHG